MAYAIRFNFRVTNNELDYKAFIAGLSLALIVGVDHLEVIEDS